MQYEISVVIPVFNQVRVLPVLHRRLNSSLSGLNVSYEIIYVEDGCPPPTQAMLTDVCLDDEKATIVELTRNFGQSNALAAGLLYAKGKFVVVMDADLQDKPEDIHLLYKRIVSSQADMVFAGRPCSNCSRWRVLVSVAFYRLSRLLTTVNQPPNTGVFRIIRGDFLQRILAKPPQPGTLLSRLQKNTQAVDTVLTSRNVVCDDKSGYTLPKLIRLGMERFLVYPRYRLPIISNHRFLKRFIPYYEIKQIHLAGNND